MTMTRNFWHGPLKRLLLTGVLTFVPLGAVCAWQAATQPTIRPVPPSVQFQQDAQQQKLRDDLQKSQQQQQLRQGVAEVAGRTSGDDAGARKQREQARQAQHERDRAAQQDLLDRQRDDAALGRVIPMEFPRSEQSTH